MSTYKDLVGQKIKIMQVILLDQQVIFYDSTNLDFKYQFPNVSTAWRTGNDLNISKDKEQDREHKQQTLGFWW